MSEQLPPEANLPVPSAYTAVDPEIFTSPPARSPSIPIAPAKPAPKPVEMTIDGVRVSVSGDMTILEACRAQGIDIPTLCTLSTLTPEGVCRLCVVDTGARALTPSCAAQVAQGMNVETENERVRHSRKLVLEMLASSVDLDLAGPELPDGSLRAYMKRYGADPGRFGPPTPPAAAGERDAARAGHHRAPDGATASTVGQPAKVDNDLFVRDYSKCILCYKCVEACGVDAQNTFAISVAGRGFGARVATEFDIGLTESACVFCGNCINVCPTGALMFRSEYQLRQADDWREDDQSTTRTICPYCGVGCTLELHVQDNRIVKVLSPLDADVTHGNLCVKGRFGFDFVQVRPKGSAREA
jgi:predicted molibdopterin-dependent oxidoreductase YjgC